MRWLFVLAHPDDEADVGGTIWKLTQSGQPVAVAILVGKVAARRNLSDLLDLEEAESMKILGVKKTYHADFPNIKMNVVPNFELIRFIEECILDWRADSIVTHHTSDVNTDHQETGKATLAACRIFQQREERTLLKNVLMCETFGATEWALNSSQKRFLPNYYIEIGEDGLEKKVMAHMAYKGVMRVFPHPQCYSIYKGLAAYRGVQSSCKYAEAFQCVFKSE